MSKKKKKKKQKHKEGNKATHKIKVVNELTPDQEERYEEVNHKKLICTLVLTGIFAFLLAVYIILMTFKVKTVIVEGNQHYTDQEITAIVQKGKFGDNSIFLSLKYSNKPITGVPFVSSMDVDVLDKNTIKVTVYEKKLAGYVEYLGKYMYFDKDGVIVENSSVKTPGIPMVTGLTFDHFTMYEPLPVDNEKVFKTILNITQLLNKYEIETDKIYFDKDYEMTLYFGDIRVAVGDKGSLEEKIQMLTSILPQLQGQKGLLNMKSYDQGLENITFTQE